MAKNDIESTSVLIRHAKNYVKLIRNKNSLWFVMMCERSELIWCLFKTIPY